MRKLKVNNGKGMVDVGSKRITKRKAKAQAVVLLSKNAFSSLMEGSNKKGDVFETAKVAGIMATKNTPLIVPYCHPILLTKSQVSFEVDEKLLSVRVISVVEATGQTGVEMEAMSSATAAALTIYDMLKSVDKGIEITDVALISKEGGKSGDYQKKGGKPKRGNA